MPHAVLLPWRMQLHALTGDPAGALRILNAHARPAAALWPAWWIAARCWHALGDRSRALEALTLASEAGAPDALVGTARATLGATTG
jgi:hypothetical protein